MLTAGRCLDAWRLRPICSELENALDALHHDPNGLKQIMMLSFYSNMIFSGGTGCGSHC